MKLPVHRTTAQPRLECRYQLLSPTWRYIRQQATRNRLYLYSNFQVTSHNSFHSLGLTRILIPNFSLHYNSIFKIPKIYYSLSIPINQPHMIAGCICCTVQLLPVDGRVFAPQNCHGHVQYIR